MGGGGTAAAAAAAAESIGDLEDLAASTASPDARLGGHALPAMVARRRAGDSSSSAVPKPPGELPGMASVWVKTFGCSHNVSDSEYMAGMLSSYGYR